MCPPSFFVAWKFLIPKSNKYHISNIRLRRAFTAETLERQQQADDDVPRGEVCELEKRRQE